MKLAVALLLVLASTPTRAEPLVVTARVAEIPDKLGYCGVIAVRAAIRYELIAVERSPAAPPKQYPKDVYVVVTCPETFKVGMKHRMTLVPAGPKGTYIDRFGGTAPRYHATKRTDAGRSP